MSLPAPYFQDEAVTIYHGDCRELLPALATESVDGVFTSPPYNKGLRGDHRTGWVGIVNRSSKANRFRDGYGGGTSDALPWPEYLERRRSETGEMWRVLKPSGVLYLNHKPRVWMGLFWNPVQILPNEAMLRQVITWNRGGAIDVSERGYASACEWIMFCPKPEHRIPKSLSARGDVWDIPQERGEFDHPATFPLALPKRAMSGARPAELWLDPYAGTGTTLSAAKALGLRSIGIEIEERYCEIAAKRMAQGVLL